MTGTDDTVSTSKQSKDTDPVREACRLPRAVSQRMRAFVHANACCGDEHASPQVKYLWIHVGSCEERVTPDDCGCDDQAGMSIDDWYNVVDETAALGADTVFVTAGKCLKGHSEVWDICRWAQRQHAMNVGLHISPCCFDEPEIEQLRSLDPQKLCIYIDGDDTNCLANIASLGIQIRSANGLEDGSPQPTCSFPSMMTCVDGDGTMYTCGLVIGQQAFEFGNANERRVDSVLRDNSLPHQVPENTSTAPGRCNGCPPLLERKAKGLAGHHCH